MQTQPFIHHVLAPLTQSAHWFKRRDECMEGARRNITVLMDKNSHWGYDRRHPVVLASNEVWINRAKHCHALAMGRKPLFFEIPSRTGIRCKPPEKQ